MRRYYDEGWNAVVKASPTTRAPAEIGHAAWHPHQHGLADLIINRC